MPKLVAAIKQNRAQKSDPEETQPEAETKIITQIWHHHK
jgi:hypothetical protein